jgi:hypothetical protein
VHRQRRSKKAQRDGLWRLKPSAADAEELDLGVVGALRY